MDRPLVAVVLAGGTGTRLYPASRKDRPKQFCSFGGDRSLLARTVDRVSFADDIVVLTGDRYADRIGEHAPDADVLVEPAPKDTGPALVYAAARLQERFEDPVLLTLPSDHHVAGDFETPAREAAHVAHETGGLITLGVEPTRPATGYGYIEPEEEPSAGSSVNYAPVARFREKPDGDRASALVEAGCYWNAGIFAWTPDTLLREARGTPVDSIARAADSDPTEEALETAIEDVDPISIDYAVLERTEEAYVVPVAFEWDDLGSWDAMERIVDLDADGNAVLGDALTLDAADNVIATDDAHVSVLGAEDLVVAAYDDRVLVVPKDEAQGVRAVVDRLRDAGLF
ncbi:MAG: mannose-1-phosphate guanylyltransferase [Halobacteriales archaeon]|jgi:mannose-1-phosphate guanylyltransferase